LQLKWRFPPVTWRAMSETYPLNDGQGAPDETAAAEKPAEAEEAPLELGREAALEAKIADLNDRVLRLAAELENTRRRGEREKIDASRYAIAGFARELLAVSDNFERALQNAPADGSSPTGETVAAFITGVRMTERALAAALERHGVRKIDPRGEKFDPNLHQAVAQAPAVGVPAGFVAETAQPGYVLGERVLRAAMVVVSTGEPHAAPQGSHIDTSV
jgi:molecular chaperone GrpE